ncbi:MAG: tRNA uridine-5-carboxymethylaminomethyl(34) synthesis GTPase MnmE [Prevotella sp.]|nr:tRNA uridine-5-carboxymethylaminomethyl(34) synthesis GTPase MnmE [Prevotella sp.]
MKNLRFFTIAAIAANGAIGIIRISGLDAISIVDRIFTPMHGGALSERKAYTITYGKICASNGDIIDEVLVSLFRAPHSYTGEDSVEISCHGSSYILRKVMQLLIENGCRQAGPGEFTMRAFTNGKMDLTQAEAVADLIASSTEAAHKTAINQMRGGFSKELALLRDKLLHLTSLLELELDFSDHEELEFADRTELKAITTQIENLVSKLVNSFAIGNAIKNGVPVIIIGETNAGKSTLLNALLNENRAIVSDIHGTTRDAIEETMNLNGITYRFIDTAGIRSTTDKIESLGIERTFQKLDQAKIVLWVIDATDKSNDIAATARLILPNCTDKKLILVYNKIDLLHADAQQKISTLTRDTQLYISTTNAQQFNTSTNLQEASQKTQSSALPPSTQTICISAKNNEHIDDLKTLIASDIDYSALASNEVIVTNVRHYEALNKALDAIHRIQQGLSDMTTTDLISLDLHECLDYLSQIIGGEITSTDVLQNIFKNFCIGK